MNKAKATKITIEHLEGQRSGTRTFEGNNAWNDAQRYINEYCLTDAPKLGYHKTQFVVEFEDGETYVGRIDLSHPDARRRDSHNLADHIARHCLFYMGRWCPPHLTEEQYRKYMNDVDVDFPGLAESTRQFWEQYEIPSSIANTAEVTKDIAANHA